MAQYRYDTLTSKTVAWKSKTGNALMVDIALIQEMSDYFGNGEYSPTRDGLSVWLTPSIDGAKETPAQIQRLTGPVAARIGKIGLLPERLAEIEQAIAEVEAHPAYVYLMTARAKGEQAAKEYDKHVAAVDRMMTLDGRTY